MFRESNIEFVQFNPNKTVLRPENSQKFPVENLKKKAN